jgi:hypothetical protein
MANRGSIPGTGWEFFSSPPLCPERLWGPPSLQSNGYGGDLSVEVKRPGPEADHSSLSTAEAKNAWGYTSSHAHVFMAWCLVKHKDNFTIPPQLWKVKMKERLCHMSAVPYSLVSL